MDLARELSSLAEHVDWPATPELRLELEPRARRRSRRPLYAALAFAAIVALAAAFAVPESRGAILRFLHLGGVTIERVDTLPPAEQRPLEAGIGRPVSLAEAKRLFGNVIVLPDLTPLPQLHIQDHSVLSTVFEYHGQPVLLTQFGFGNYFLKKLAAGGTSVVDGGMPDSVVSLWISGVTHDVYFPGASPRLAGNVLLWEREGITYRLEGRSLSREDAVALARSLTRH
jgi:hypothetical protein